MSSQKTSSGIGFVGLLTILFIGLKLTNYINWRWLWVLSPLWITPLVLMGILIMGFLIFLIVKLLRNKK